MSVSKRLSINLKKLRKAKNLTQEELAEKIDSTKQMVANVENERVWPRLENVKALAKALEVEETALFADPTIIDDEVVLERIKQLMKNE